MSLSGSIGLSTHRPIAIVVSIDTKISNKKISLFTSSRCYQMLAGGSANERLHLNLPTASVHRVHGHYLL